MKKLFVLVAVVIAAAVLGWWLIGLKNRAPQVPFAKVQRGKLISMLPTNGKVEPIEWQAVRAQEAGLIETVPVQEGQEVSKGQVIATLRQTGLDAELEAAQARVTQARAELATVEAGGKAAELAEIDNNLARYRLDRDQAQREYSSLQRLAEKQATTAVEVASAREKVRQGDLRIEGLERRRAALVGKNDKAVAQAHLKDAEAALALAQTRIAQTVFRAPIGGAIYELSVRPGAYVHPGDLLTDVGETRRLRVRVYVDEPELGRVAPGQPVTITWDGLPGKTWEGTVEKMPSEIIALGTRQVGEVKCTIDNVGMDLKPGSNITANVRTNLVQDALTIPKEALRRDGNETGVYLLQGETIGWRKVQTGASNITRVQIVEGLKEGDAVALPTELVLRNGLRVAPTFPM